MHEVKASLQQLVVSDAWGEWNQKLSHEMEGEEVHDILTSATFWKGVKELLAVSESIVYLLRQCDKGVPVVGKVYYAMFLIDEELGALKEGTSEQHLGVKLSAVKYEQINWLWPKRSEYLHSDYALGWVCSRTGVPLSRIWTRPECGSDARVFEHPREARPRCRQSGKSLATIGAV
jgi:hypothetical protein